MKALTHRIRLSSKLLQATLLVMSLTLMSFSAEAHSLEAGGKKTKAEKKEAKLAKKTARDEARRLKEMAMLDDVDYMDESTGPRTRPERPTRRPDEPRTEIHKTENHDPETRARSTTSGPSIGSMEDYALSLQGIPYRYGGTDTKGFDCSGYVKHVFDKEGVFVPRTAQAQFETCDLISDRQADKGDLVFFGKSKKHIDHVGILISPQDETKRMIHSSSSQGIVITNIEESAYWKPRLVGYGKVRRD